MTTQRKVVAVTGSSGYIGAKLLEHLEETPELGNLVAFDTRPMPAPIHNIAAYRRHITARITDHHKTQPAAARNPPSAMQIPCPSSRSTCCHTERAVIPYRVSFLSYGKPH